MNDVPAMSKLRSGAVSERGGLQLNNVGKSSLLLQVSGLSEKMRTDLRMRVQSDLVRYPEFIALTHGAANREFQGVNSSPPSMVSLCWSGENYRDDGWSEYDSPDTWRPD